VVGSRDVTEVTLEALGGPVRTTTRELELRAQRPGALVIGPVRVEQGGRRVTTAALTVTVDSARRGLGAAVSPIARRLREPATPPPPVEQGERGALSVLLPGDAVLVGQQLDVIAVAWFPRDLRERLRRAPILTLQTPEGVWSYPGAAPSEVAASRLVRGRWLDLFVAHEAVFPLTPGRILIPPATVEYAVPASFSFFSREDRYSLRSDTVPVQVLPLPGAPARPGGPGSGRRGPPARRGRGRPAPAPPAPRRGRRGGGPAGRGPCRRSSSGGVRWGRTRWRPASSHGAGPCCASARRSSPGCGRGA